MSPLPLTDPHHMVIKQFLLLGLAAKYRSRRWCDKHYGRPLDVYETHRRTKLTALETISRWLLLKKRKKSLFELPFRVLRGNVRTPSMARWKVRGRLYIRRNWTFIAISYGWDVISGNGSKSAFFQGGGSIWAQISEGKGASPTNHCWCQSSVVIALSCGIKITAVRHLALSQSTRVTDGQTDGQNYDSQVKIILFQRAETCLKLFKNYFRGWEQLLVNIYRTCSISLK